MTSGGAGLVLAVFNGDKMRSSSPSMELCENKYVKKVNL